jgi:hypothetical protein
MSADSFEEKVRRRREEEAAQNIEARKAIDEKSFQEAQARRLAAERARLEAEKGNAVIDAKLQEQRAAAAERAAIRRVKLDESETTEFTKAEIIKAISSTKLGSVFFQKSHFLENGETGPGYVKDFVSKAAEAIAEAESLNDPEFSGERFFNVILDGYRRVPKLCMEAVWLIINVEGFLDRVSGWPDHKRIEMKLRALSGSMGKGILSANHLIKSEIIKTRSGGGSLHEGPLFKELNILFKEKGERYDERLRDALRMSWVFAFAEMARAGIPERYRLNMDATDDVTLLLKILIAETAMERHPYGPNKRRQTLSQRDRVSEIVKNTGEGLMFRKSAVTEWLRTHDGLESLDLTYFPTEIFTIEHEGLSGYSETLVDCVTAAFPEASQVNAPLCAEVIKKLLAAQFSVKKKFTLKMAPAPGALSVKTLDYDGETVIREINIPNKTSVVTPAQPGASAIPAPFVQASPATVPKPQIAPRIATAEPLNPIQAPKQTPAKRRLDLDLS